MNTKPTNSRRTSMSSGAMFFVIAVIFVLSLPSGLLGHGVKIDVSQETPFVVINAYYHGGKSLVDAEVTIWFNSDAGDQKINNEKNKNQKDAVYQKGRTDHKGRFVFMPHQAGNWDIRVDDLTGHRGKKSFSLDAEFFKKPTVESPAPSTESGTETATEPKVDSNPDAKPDTNVESNVESKDDLKSDESGSPFSSSQWCCFMLKILLGVVLILVITFVMHRLTKPKA
jgi:hypothetical protein